MPSNQVLQRYGLTRRTVSNDASGRCLDVSGGGTSNGSDVIVWSCHGGSNRHWNR